MMANKVIRHYFSGRPFDVPWDQWCFWLEKGPAQYYPEEIIPFTEQLNAFGQPFDFIDLGADVGVVSLAVAQNCPNIKQLLAIEPNPAAYQLLQKNIAALPVHGSTINAAISDYDGSAMLQCNATTISDHGGSISYGQPGQTQVFKLDSLIKLLQPEPSDRLAVKLDVEGQEMQFFAGASHTIKQASRVVLLLEVHPKVLTRNDQTPELLFEAAEALRPFKWFVPAIGSSEVDRSKLFFEQFEQQQYDIIGVSQ
ncbi:FkbM family methyltransferase [Neiella marina]|uniref:FkbM family methyltransferase n=2 Tax=Neiella holothuriorum TaxID=2870530 RepID=A0ABS7EH76_9GAMM|nr:FkbM family methyltransferase [Neiella holothuriorum]